jgi:ribonuclease P protein component
MTNFGLPRSKSLKHRKAIDALFTQGKSVSDYPVRVIWFIDNEAALKELKVLFSVSKRQVKTAVGRNRQKRIMREVFRIQFSGFKNLAEHLPGALHIAVLSNSREFIGFDAFRIKLNPLLERCMHDVAQKTIKNASA